MRPRFTAIILFLTCICASSTLAQVDLHFSGSIRYRQEVYKLGFRPNSEVSEFAQMQTRIAVEAIIDSVAKVYVQIQDSRTMGGTDMDARLVSGTLRPKNNVDLHQAFIEVPNLAGSPLFLKAGRFEVEHGNGRLFGVERFHYVGRAWEGAQIGFRSDHFQANLSRLRLFEQITYGCGGPDADLWIAMISPRPWLQGLIAYEYELGYVFSTIDRIRRFTAAVYGRRVLSNFVVETNVATQFGRLPAFDGAYFEKKIAAYLFAFEFGYVSPQDSAIYVGAGCDWSSGDKKGTYRIYEAFESEYYSARDFRGAMGYFTYNSPPYALGLLDLYLKCRAKLGDRVNAELSLHRFTNSESYSYISNRPETKKLGWEIDGNATAHLSPRVIVEFDSGLFLPSEEYSRQSYPSPGLWFSGALGATF